MYDMNEIVKCWRAGNSYGCFDGRPWTPERVEKLERLWIEEGLSASQIGQLLGKTKNSVIGKLDRLGLLGIHERPPAGILTKRLSTPEGRKLGTRLLSMGDDACRWPVGDNFCGLNSAANSSYCEHHQGKSRGASNDN